jgi:hypothetical protein
MCDARWSRLGRNVGGCTAVHGDCLSGHNHLPEWAVDHARGTEYNALLTQYAIERFLYRLPKSEPADRFVLKGAMLLRVWAADLHRPTKHLDML